MIEFKIDETESGVQIETLHLSGTPTFLGAEIAALVGVVHQKIKAADEEEGAAFQMAMRNLMEPQSPVWSAQDLPGDTTVIRMLRK